MSAPRPQSRKIAAALAVAALVGCGDNDEPTGATAGDSEIRGSVASARTAVGIPNLVVALVSQGDVIAAAPTDEAGRFAFEGIPRGSYIVHVTGLELSALSAKHTVLEPSSAGVTVAGDPVEVLFAAVGVIPPRIVGDIRCNGTFVEGAQVRIVGGETDIVVATNAQGRYAATDLTPGHYAVIVTAAPCTITPAYGVASLLPAQAAEIDFDG